METTPLLLVLSTLILSTLLYILTTTKRGGGGASHHRLPPGPKGWPMLGNLPQLGPKPHQTLAALAKTHGPILRLRLGHVEVVVASSPSAAASFLKTHDANFADRPPNTGGTHMAYDRRDLVFAPYGPRWRMLRRLCSLRLFSNKALDEFTHVREDEVLRMARSFASASGALVNVGKRLNACATDALGRTLMGRRVFGEGREGEAEEFKDMVAELMVLAGEFNVGDFVWGLGWLDLQGIVGRMKRLHRRYDGFLDRIIKEHSMDCSDRKGDFLSVLIGLKDVDGEEGLDDVEIKALLLNMFSAGTDTSSSTVEWGLAELIRQPDILKKAQQELDLVVGRARLVSESDLGCLPYFEAVVKETFRLHPSTPLSIPHMASDDCYVDDYFIPKGTTLFVNVWAITHDSKVWPDPLKFDPARFFPDGPAEHVDVKGNNFELIPFGAGRRICVGLNMGLRIVQLMLATLVHGFDWAVDGKVDMEEAYGITLQRAVPLSARPTPRLEPHVYDGVKGSAASA